MIFLQPKSLSELAEALSQKGENGFIVAGCTDFLAKRNGKSWGCEVLIDVLQVPELCKIACDGENVTVGACCTHTRVEEDPLVRKYVQALSEACGDVGSKQIRNRGTVGGSVCNASAAGDIFPVLLLMGARARLMNGSGRERVIPVEQMIAGAGKNSLFPDEALLSCEIPVPPENSLCAFKKLGDRAKVTIAKIDLAVKLEMDGTLIRDARVVLGAVSEKAFLSGKAASYLRGKSLSGDLAPEFENILSEEICRSIPGRASLAYKKEAVKGLAEDVLLMLTAKMSAGKEG